MSSEIASAIVGRTAVKAKRSRVALLRDLRHRMGGISQEELARRLGVSWSTVSRWENGKGTPSPLAREKLLQLLRAAGLEARLAELGQMQ